MMRSHQVSFLWRLYLEIVHTIVVFEVVFHELPHGFISLFWAVIKMVEQNSSVLAIVLAVMVSLVRTALSARVAESPTQPEAEPKEAPKERSKEKPKPKPSQQRDQRGRPKANR